MLLPTVREVPERSQNKVGIVILWIIVIIPLIGCASIITVSVYMNFPLMMFEKPWLGEWLMVCVFANQWIHVAIAFDFVIKYVCGLNGEMWIQLIIECMNKATWFIVFNVLIEVYTIVVLQLYMMSIHSSLVLAGCVLGTIISMVIISLIYFVYMGPALITPQLPDE